MDGRVVSFDEAAGFGHLEPEAGGAALFFHCTQIADGSRAVAAGTPVTFEVEPGHLGRYEAVRVTPTGQP